MTAEMPLRVLVVIRSRHVWGLERSVMDGAPLMAGRGVELVLGSPPGGELVERWRRLGLAHVALELPERSGLRAADGEHRLSPLDAVHELGATARGVSTLRAAARRVDVVHSASLWVHLDCVLAGQLARRPVAVELVDMVRPGLGRQVLSIAVRLSTETFANSRAVAGCVSPGPARRVRIIPPGVDAQRFRPGPADRGVRRELSDDPDAALVGMVGRLDPDKGVELVVEAMARLGSPSPAQLVVVGGPGLAGDGYAAEVEAEARARLGGRVRFLGWTEDVPATLRALDVLVNASVAEPFGLSVLEAQACGVPVVVTDGGGVVELVSHEEDGLVVRRDPQSLADALGRLLPDPALRREMGRRGRRAAEARSLDARADALAELYRRCARRRTVPGGERSPAPEPVQ